MNFLTVKNNKWLIFAALSIWLIILIFLRTVNLNTTARFTYDESSDLARMHEIIETKHITLVGPISTDNKKVFSSLSYYMILPFLILGKSAPISAYYGAVFWGVLTATSLLLLAWKYNRKYLPWIGILTLVWYPLILISRWVWNPHYMMLWISLGIYCYFLKKKSTWFLSGLFMGMAFHNHYIAVVSTIVFMIVVSLRELRNKNYLLPTMLWLGYAVTLIPFAVYDILKPPGLFFGKYLISGSDSYLFKFDLASLSTNFFRSFVVMSEALASSNKVSYLLLLIVLFLLAHDIYKKNIKALWWWIPISAQLLMGLFMDDYLVRYFLPALPFFLMWLITPRIKWGGTITKMMIGVMILGSILSLKPLLTEVDFPPSLAKVVLISDALEKVHLENDIKNTNIAALSSHDREPLAYKYRELLKTRDIRFREISEYDVSEHLFVITTASLDTLLKDESYAMKAFSGVPIQELIEVEDTEWKIYWFNKLLPREKNAEETK